MQIKTTMRFRLTRVPIIKVKKTNKQKINVVGKHVEKLELLYIAGRDVK